VGPPAISKEGIIYIGSSSDYSPKLYALNPNTGEKVWEAPSFSIPGQFSNPVVGWDGTIYCLFKSKIGSGFMTYSLYAIYPDGTIKGYTGDALNLDYPTSLETSPAIGPDGRIWVVGRQNLYVIWPADFHIKTIPLPSPPSGSPVIAESEVIVPCENHIVGVDPLSGIDWTLPLETTNVPNVSNASTPAVGHGVLFYFGTHSLDGRLCDGYSGQIFDMIPMDGPVHSSPAIVSVGNQNVLYIGSKDSLSAWNNEVVGIEPGLAHTSWPCDRGNLKRTGRVNSGFSALYLVTELKVQLDRLHLGNYVISLGSKLDSAKQSLEKEDLVPARNKLGAFINEVSALKGKKIPDTEANRLIADAKVIVGMLQ
jgi:hypothetical protein